MVGVIVVNPQVIHVQHQVNVKQIYVIPLQMYVYQQHARMVLNQVQKLVLIVVSGNSERYKANQ